MIDTQTQERIVQLLDEADALKLQFIKKGYAMSHVEDIDRCIETLEKELYDEAQHFDGQG